MNRKLTLNDLTVSSFKTTEQKIIGGQGTHVSCQFVDGRCVNEMVEIAAVKRKKM